MSNDVQIDELLSAYLAGDVTPTERAAVEHRLANNPALRNLLAELEPLAAILKQAQRPVTAAMLAELKRRVESSTPKSSDLLAASLSGDLNSAERASVEQLLHDHPEARRELASLRALSSFLKQAERPVTPAMLAEFKRRMEGATAKPVELLSASVTGDLNPLERASVAQFLKDQPAAQRELASLRAMSTFLKKAELSPSKNASRKLIDRLSAKLPAKALAPVLPSAHETVAIKLQTSAPLSAPTVRIYAAQESPWRKRILRAAAAMAAAIVFAAGTIFGLKALNTTTDETQGAKGPLPNHNPAPMNPPDSTPIEPNEIQPAPNSQNVTPTHAPLPPVSEVPPAPPTQLPDGVIVPTADPRAIPPQPNTTPEPHQTAPVTAPHTPKSSRTPDAITPTPAPAPAVEPAHGPMTEPEPALDPDQKKVVQQNGGLPIVAPNSPLILVPPSNNGVADNTNPNKPLPPVVPSTTQTPAVTPSTGPSTVVPTPVPPAPNQTPTLTPTPDPTPPTPDNSFVAAVDGKMVAAVIRDATDASATTPTSVQTIQVKDVLPSNTTITTGNTRIAFVLPEDGRLWVNRHSKVTVQLQGLNTIVNIESGEVSYRAPVGGSVTINHPSGLSADSTSLMDVAIDDTTSSMVAYAIASPGKVVRKAKGATSLKSNQKAVAKLDQSITPTVQAGADQALLWQQDLNVNGDPPDGLTPSNKKKDKTQGRKKTK